MSWPFRDYDYIGNRYVNIKDENHLCGEIMWYERKDIDKAPTECVMCIEAENDLYTKYSHPKAHLEAHILANVIAEKKIINEKDTEECIENYIFYYGKEYRKIYKELYKKYKEEYSIILMEKSSKENNKICDYHLESIQYHYEKFS